MPQIHVLIVNDSLVITHLMKKILAADPQFGPVHWAKDGLEAEQYVRHQQPDIILMDIHMPRQDGVETTRKILSQSAIPILVVTATITKNMSAIYQCLEYGALEAIKPPQLSIAQNSSSLSADQIRTMGKPFLLKVKALAQLRHKVEQSRQSSSLAPNNFQKRDLRPLAKAQGKASHLVVLGASTGGPKTLQYLLSKFPADFSAAVVLVQHMDADFIPSFIEHLSGYCPLPIETALEGVSPQKGRVYVAHEKKRHLRISSQQTFCYSSEPETLHMPSIDVFFASVAEHFGRRAVGALLTGMGEDGARGLQQLRKNYGFTIAQDEASSVIYGMPKKAAELDAADQILGMEEISPAIVRHLMD
ncbi:MAG: chemotaxis-specific protein-glutamate methyltransferase CheB [SAR324 cluster bacterium]|nr:chemotaxis-specific protein-glutamate methyltransferase CheB [SAR324 cluster bacterium]